MIKISFFFFILHLQNKLYKYSKQKVFPPKKICDPRVQKKECNSIVGFQLATLFLHVQFVEGGGGLKYGPWSTSMFRLVFKVCLLFEKGCRV